MVREFINFKKNESNKTKDSKKLTSKVDNAYSQVQAFQNKLTSSKGPKPNKSANPNQNIKESSSYKDIEAHAQPEMMGMLHNYANEGSRDDGENLGQPHVPMLSLGRIGENEQKR